MTESAVSGTLLMSGFQIFAADAAFQNHAQRDFLTHPTKKNALSSPDFCQKAWWGGTIPSGATFLGSHRDLIVGSC